MESLDGQPYDDSPAGKAKRWHDELHHARKEVRDWHEQGDKVVKRFRDERDSAEDDRARWNLFSANVQTQRAMLYGQTPRVSVERRFGDAKDDVARVAGEMLERLLNADIERDSDTFAQAVEHALSDRLLGGLGLVRIRYEAEFEEVPGQDAVIDPVTGAVIAEAIPPSEVKSYECVETDYVYWKDVLWSPARVWGEVRWVAFRAQMSRDALVQRFGEDVGKAVPLSKGKPSSEAEGVEADPWERADVWEVWDKETRTVVWVVEGYAGVLDEREDPLGLESFFPCPRPLVANATTNTLVPRPDFVLAQDLYDEVDKLAGRRRCLLDGLKVAGVYDQRFGEIQRLVRAGENVLIPVESWSEFSEKGGIRASIDWMPLDQVAAALAATEGSLRVAQEALYQVTGMSDIMRGQASAAATTATEQGIKARFASVRIQATQDEVARFASETQRLKAEVIAQHFEPGTIIQQSNAAATFEDQAQVLQAVQLIKSDVSRYRVEVKPEALSLTDFAALKQERMETLAGISAFLQMAAGVVQTMPEAMPFMLQMLQWHVAGLRGASGIEGILDQAIAEAQQRLQQQAQQPQQQPPDPKVLVQQMKDQTELRKLEMEARHRIQELAAEVAADAQREANQTRANVTEHLAKTQITAQYRPQGGGQP